MTADPVPRVPVPRWDAIDRWLDAAYPRVVHVDVPTLARRLADPAAPPPRLVDVRAHAEVRVSRLPGAAHATDLDALLALAADRAPGAPLVLYCSVGVRSARWAATLGERGVRDAWNLRGSIFDWANRGLPLHDAHGAPVARVHPFDARWAALLDPARRAAP